MKRNITCLPAAFVLSSGLLLGGCQKDTVPPAATDTQLTGSYKVTAMILKKTDGTQFDLFAKLPDCQKNNIQKLNRDHSYQLLDACDAAENQNGSWQMSGSNKIMINGVMANLDSFNQTRIIISLQNFMSMGATLTETLTRQ